MRISDCSSDVCSSDLLIDRAAVVRAHIMGVLRPTGRGQHQIAYAPFVDLSLDDALAAIADEIIIDRRRAVAMPAQDRRRRIAASAAGHRGEEAMGGAVADRKSTRLNSRP